MIINNHYTVRISMYIYTGNNDKKTGILMIIKINIKNT
jgi:hypothetical protein